MHKTRDHPGVEHANYPHWPGYLWDCYACETYHGLAEEDDDAYSDL